MPSNETARRRVLAGLGTAVASGLAGCGGRLPGAGPDRLDAETEIERDRDPRILWRYPPREDDADGIGYAAVAVDRVIRRDASTPALALEFNSTIGGLAPSEPYDGYRPDWFRFRVWPPTTYEMSLQYRLRVEPPGQWEHFSAHYDVHGTVRRTTVELRNRDTGTDPDSRRVRSEDQSASEPSPLFVHSRASRPGLLGRSVRVSDRGILPLADG